MVLCYRTYCIWSIHLPVDGHLDCFHILAIMNSCIHVQVSVYTYVFIYLGYMTRSGITGSYVTPCLNFRGTAKPLCKVAASFHRLTNNTWCFNFSMSLTMDFAFFLLSQPNGYEVICDWGFNLHFPNWTMISNTFLCTYWPLVYCL